MGKCLSRCTDTNCSTPNGHMGSSILGKPMTSHTSEDHRTPRDSEAQGLQFQIEPLTAGSGSRELNTAHDVHLGIHPYPVCQNGDRPSTFTSNRKPCAAKHQRNNSFELAAWPSDDGLDTKLNAFFNQYKDPTEDNILADGIEKLCADLAVRPDEFRVLVLAWKFQAETMCRFTRAEFVGGCKTLGVSDISGIQRKFPDMTNEVKDKHCFKEMYRWAFRFALDSEYGQRTLPLDMAISMWSLVFSESKPPMLSRWLEFLESHRCVRGITKDTWDMFLNFLDSVSEDLSGYDDTEAWPSLFDDFVEWANDPQK